jgi:hypothetical protein
MSNDLSFKSVCVCDDGQFIDVATRLSKEFGQVYFWNPSLMEGFPTIRRNSIGKGFEEFTWIRELWPLKDKIDLFVFLDCQNAGLQLELESQGKRVIGSRYAENLEQDRIGFKKVQERLGLKVPVHEVVFGLQALREHLSGVKDKWVKWNRYRGSFETQHHLNYELSQPWLDALAVECGPMAEKIYFLVEDPIKGAVEIGYDGFNFKGVFPSKTLFGPEIKSKCYIGAVVNYEDLDERVREVNEKLVPELEKAGYRNFFSTEIRIAEDDENFEDGTPVLIEPTCRIPSPPFEAELEIYGNLGAMLWHGSVGEVIEPEMTAKYAVACRMTHDDDAKGWRALQIKDDIRQWVKIYDACMVDGTYWIAPKEPHAKRIGCIVGIGETIEDALEHCREVREELKDQPVGSEFDSLVDAIKELESAEEQGIEFGKDTIPAPEVVLE